MDVFKIARSFVPASKGASKPAREHASGAADGRSTSTPAIPTDPRTWLTNLQRLPERSSRPLVISHVGKGGSAKTTSAVSLATIASYLGYSVWLLDLDPQGSASIWRKKRGDRAASGTGAGVVVHKLRPMNLGRAIEASRRERVGLIIIDNPPTRHEHAIAVAHAADLVVVTCGAALFDLEETLHWIEFLRENDVEPVVVLGNAPPRREDNDSPLVAGVRGALMRTDEVRLSAWSTARLWKGQVTRRHAVVHATARGAATIETEPEGASAEEFRRLWNFLVRQLKEVKP